MKRNLLFVTFCFFSSIVLFAQTPGTVQDPRIGTWKLNPEKSQLAQAPPRMSVRRYEARPDGFIVDTTIGVDGEGNPVFAQVTFKLDGKDYAQYTQTSLAALSSTASKPSTNSYKPLDANTVEVTTRDNSGKVTATSAHTVSQDRKTLTITTKGAAGKVTNTAVWDRQ